MGKIFNACVADGYNMNWQKKCQELTKGTCKSLRNQQKFNEAKRNLESQGVAVDLLDLAALVSSTQAASDITGIGTGNQFCENKSTPFPFISLLGKAFEKGQNASGFAKVYNAIQSSDHFDKLCNLIESTDIQESLSHKYFLPGKEEFELAYKSLAPLGNDVSIDAVLDKIESNAKQYGLFLKEGWREVTERNISIWTD